METSMLSKEHWEVPKGTTKKRSSKPRQLCYYMPSVLRITETPNREHEAVKGCQKGRAMPTTVYHRGPHRLLRKGHLQGHRKDR
jgi:hypothetical protein